MSLQKAPRYLILTGGIAAAREISMIRPQEIRDLLKKQPFRPFRIHMSNGKSYDVQHPELALVTRSEIVVSQPVPGSADPMGEGIHLVSVLHINSIEILPKSNGTKKTKKDAS
jgi:hypothetical protein